MKTQPVSLLWLDGLLVTVAETRPGCLWERAIATNHRQSSLLFFCAQTYFLFESLENQNLLIRKMSFFKILISERSVLCQIKKCRKRTEMVHMEEKYTVTHVQYVHT